MNFVKIRTHCKAYYLAQHGEMRNSVLEAELKMDASQTVKRIKLLGPNLALCQLATWTENAIKLEL